MTTPGSERVPGAEAGCNHPRYSSTRYSSTGYSSTGYSSTGCSSTGNSSTAGVVVLRVNGCLAGGEIGLQQRLLPGMGLQKGSGLLRGGFPAHRVGTEQPGGPPDLGGVRVLQHPSRRDRVDRLD